MGREYSLFDICTPLEKVGLGLCPQGRCMEKANTGFSETDAADRTCCCKHCWEGQLKGDGGTGYCKNCPITCSVPVEDDDE